MCGIAGSNKREQAFKLYQGNLDRGFYSSSVALVTEEHTLTYNKCLGQFSEPVKCESLAYYLYHSRGPTTETKDFIPSNNHPFEYENWVVAHNGIISNFEELAVKYFPGESFEGKTDSCIIPRMIIAKQSLAAALEELKGTFALWMFNHITGRTFITRCGSTLYANMENGDFSSTSFEGSISLEEGVVYEVERYSTIKKINVYKYDSPYFVI